MSIVRKIKRTIAGHIYGNRKRFRSVKRPALAADWSKHCWGKRIIKSEEQNNLFDLSGAGKFGVLPE